MKWIDDISEEYSNYFSFDKFVNRIGYETALTSKIIDLNSNAKHTSRPADPTQNTDILT